RAEDRPVEDMPPIVRDRHMTAQRNAGLVKDVTQVAAAAKLGSAVIVDARSQDRFEGAAPEPREGLRAGHIPGSRNLPFGTLLTEAGTMQDRDTIRAAFDTAGVDLERPIITTCGSGVSAAVLNLALEHIGHRNHALYDGSWAEWGAYDELRVATGPA
ncbi:MAG: rhodanese-like domain-containing protein, partial [Pseudomonadota bacterium]